jgi:hypothetical protein
MAQQPKIDGRLERWKNVSKEDRRRHMLPALRASQANLEARLLAKHIEAINAAGGFRKAVATVKAAGIQLEAAS